MGQQKFTGLGGGVGPLVYQTSRHGVTVRQRINPVNPQTPAQMEARQLLAQLSRQWEALTDDHRNAWHNAAQDYVPASGSGTLTGHQLFIKINANRINFGESPINVPTPPEEFGVLTLGIGALTATSVKITVENTRNDHTGYVVRATRPISKGRSRAFPEPTWMKPFPNVAPSPAQELDITAEYIETFGPPIVGMRIVFSVAEHREGQRGVHQTIISEVA